MVEAERERDAERSWEGKRDRKTVSEAYGHFNLFFLIFSFVSFALFLSVLLLIARLSSNCSGILCLGTD